MKTLIAGFSGWALMRDGQSEAVRQVDMALTVVGTLLAIATWMMLHS